MGVTLKDIAREAGVSIVTASRVFNGVKSVRPAFRRKVMNAAKRFSYSPNLLARGLSKSRSKIVALYLRELGNPFFGRLASALCSELARKSYDLVICDSLGKTLGLSRALSCACSVLVSVGDEEIVDCLSSDSPTLGIFCSVPENKLPVNIELDFSEAYWEICVAALKDGKRSFAAFFPILKQYPNLESSKLAHLNNFVAAHADRADLQYFSSENELLDKIAADSKSVDAVFCENDLSAAQIYGKLVRAGIRIPEDIVLVGCDATVPMEGLWSIGIDLDWIASKVLNCVEKISAGEALKKIAPLKAKPII